MKMINFPGTPTLSFLWLFWTPLPFFAMQFTFWRT
jgi:hypothetical protein